MYVSNTERISSAFHPSLTFPLSSCDKVILFYCLFFYQGRKQMILMQYIKVLT